MDGRPLVNETLPTREHIFNLKAFHSTAGDGKVNLKGVGYKMKRPEYRPPSVGWVALIVAASISPFAVTSTGQTPNQRITMPSDWSHSHVVYSQPTTTEQESNLL